MIALPEGDKNIREKHWEDENKLEQNNFENVNNGNKTNMNVY